MNPLSFVLAAAAGAFLFSTFPAAAQQPRRLVLGQSQTARLGEPGDPARAGKPFHAWTLRLDTAMLAEVVLRSAAFDSYLVLQDSAGRFIAFDDNGAGGQDARLIREFVPGAPYRVLARSLNDSLGEYSIVVRRMEPVTEGIVGTVTRDQVVSGTLAAGDPVLRGGRRYRAYLFDGTAGDTVQLDLSSDAFDTYLFVQDEVGRTLAENDDFEGLNSRVMFAVPATARYRVVISVFDREATGAYRLQVR